MSEDGEPKSVTEAVFNARSDAVDARFDAVDRRFDRLEAKLDAAEEDRKQQMRGVNERFDAADAQMRNMNERFDAAEADRKRDMRIMMERFDAADADRKHQTQLVVEKFDSSIKTVLEGLAATEERLERKWEARFERLETRLDIIELVLRDHSVRLQRLEGAVANLQTDVTELRQHLENVERIVDAIQRDHSITDLEQRVRVIEERLGIEPT